MTNGKKILICIGAVILASGIGFLSGYFYSQRENKPVRDALVAADADRERLRSAIEDSQRIIIRLIDSDKRASNAVDASIDYTGSLKGGLSECLDITQWLKEWVGSTVDN